MRRPPPWLALLASLLVLYILAPLAAGLTQVGHADWAGADWRTVGGALLVSVASASLATLLAAITGIPLGFALAHGRGRWTRPVGVLVQLPLAMPPLVSGVLLLFLLGYASPIGRLTGGALTESMAAIMLAQTFVAAPFLIVAARSSFAGLDRGCAEVAATLGLRPGAVFWRVELRRAAPGIVAGASLTWLRAFGEFGATVLVAYHPYSLPVYTYVAFGARGLPAMLPILAPTLLCAVLMAGGAAMVLRRQSVRSHGAGARLKCADAAAVAAPQGKDSFEIVLARAAGTFLLDVRWCGQGRRLAILGESGSGKSMTLRAIAGLAQGPGVARFGDRDLAVLPVERRGVGYVPQDYGLIPGMAVERQIRMTGEVDADLAREWTGRLGLDRVAHLPPEALSAGQRQRVALARALARRGTWLLLLDEPFSALDAPLRRRLRGELAEVQSVWGGTTMLVTHDVEEALALADVIAVLRDGQVVQSGPAEAVWARPVDEAAALLLGARSAGRARVAPGDRLDLGDGVLIPVSAPLPEIGAAVGWAIRGEAARIDGSGRYPCTIRAVGEVRRGRRTVTVAIGASVLTLGVASTQQVGMGAGRLELEAGAVQVWRET